MDDITSRTIIIAVNIFVTIAIVSLVIIMFFQMREIYGVVATTDTSIYNKFDDVYSMYDGKETTGIGLLNAIKKYEEEYDTNVRIVYSNSTNIQEEAKNSNIREAVYLKNIMTDGRSEHKLETKYSVNVFEEQENITINFTIK